MKLPPPIARLYVVLSATLSILGLASLVDGYVIWVGFVRSLISLYQYYIRDTVSMVIGWVLPDFVPQPPDYVIDVLIIWTAAFAVFRVFVTFEKRYELIFGYHATSWYFYPPAFVLGPVLPLFFKRWTDKRTAEERDMAERELALDGTEYYDGMQLTAEGRIAIQKRIEGAAYWKKEADRVHKTFAVYYGTAIALFLLGLFVNYQILIHGR